MQLEWWHWMVLGIALVLLELAVPSFFLVWFGLGALIVGVMLAVVPTVPFAWQVLGWTAFSLVFTWLWFKVFKQHVFKSRAGMAKGSLVGEVGIVTRDIRPYEKGQIRLQKPVLGEEVWESMAEEEIRAGVRVRVLDVEGNTVKVARA
jgi:membrane protein implicated in regulation of membrane protease activity